jgi:hypothetical protein
MKTRQLPIAVIASLVAAELLILLACNVTAPAIGGKLTNVTYTTAPVLPSATKEPTKSDDTDTPEPTKPVTATPPSTQAAPATTTVPKTTTVATPSANDATKSLFTAFEKLNSAFPYRLTEASGGAMQLDRVTDFAAADRIHSTWTLGNAGQDESITIGTQTWWKLHGKWDTTPSDNSIPIDVYALLYKDVSVIQYAGQETVMGTPCFVFTFKLTITTMSYALDSTGKAWVGIADGLPHQADLVGTIRGAPFTTHLVYSYGVKFDIQQPVP